MSKNVTPKISKKKRRKAREVALQALYQKFMSGNTINEIYSQFLEHINVAKIDKIYFQSLILGVTDKCEELDNMIEPLIDRKLDELDIIEKVILRLSCYELIYKPDTPYRVIINEAIEIAKIYGATDSHKYINGVLDKIAQKKRINTTEKE